MLKSAPVTSFMKGQTIQWLGVLGNKIIRTHNEKRRGRNRIALKWKPLDKRPRERPRKGWIDMVEEYL